MWLILFLLLRRSPRRPLPPPRRSTTTSSRRRSSRCSSRSGRGTPAASPAIRTEHRLPAAAAAGRAARLDTRRNRARTSRWRAASSLPGVPHEEPAADDAAGARGGRHRVPPGRQALGDRRTIPSGRRWPTGSPQREVTRAVPLLPARPLHRVRRAESRVQLALQRVRRRRDQRVPARRSACSTTSSTGISTSSW